MRDLWQVIPVSLVTAFLTSLVAVAVAEQICAAISVWRMPLRLSRNAYYSTANGVCDRCA